MLAITIAMALPVSLNDIAKHLGLSQMTVSRVINRTGSASPADALLNLADNAVICNGLRSQVIGFQQWVTAQGWVK